MKVLYITHVSELYGANSALLNLIVGLRCEYSVEPLVIVPQEGGLTERLKQEKIPYIVAKFTRWQYPAERKMKGRSFLYYVWNEIVAFALALRLKGEKIDIVHSNSSLQYAGALISRRLSCQHVWHIREVNSEAYNLQYIYSNRFIRKMYGEANQVIAVSNYVFRHYSNMISDKNMIRIYDGVKCQSNQKTLDAEFSKIRFCTVGLISKQKNQKEIVLACKVLKERGISNFHVFLIGDGKEERKKEIERIIQDNDLKEQVTILGYCSDVEQRLQDMDVGIMASKDEAFGLATVEFMMNSMPVIGTASGATTELIEHGISGFLYELGNIQQLAEYMEWFIVNRNKVLTMGRAAYKIAKEKFNIEENIKRIYKCYLECN